MKKNPEAMLENIIQLTESGKFPWRRQGPIKGSYLSAEIRGTRIVLFKKSDSGLVRLEVNNFLIWLPEEKLEHLWVLLQDYCGQVKEGDKRRREEGIRVLTLFKG